MDFKEKINMFSDRISKVKDTLLTEEATKTSLVLPFFQLLGYDVFNPFEFVPEYTADTGTKKGEKVDYAILKNTEPIMLIEVKASNIDLNAKHINQLFRYFTVTKAKFGILTNGIVYKFFSDLEETNKMDTSPFLELNLLNLKNSAINELVRFQKEAFDLKGILDSASELKYTAMVKKAIDEQFQNPTDQFVKAIISKGVYSGVKTQSIIDKFRDIIKTSYNEYINETVNERLKNAINNTSSITKESEKVILECSQEELEVLDYIKKLIASKEKISYKKTCNYAYMQIGDNGKKWICRVYIRNSNNLFVLHKFDNTDYEHEYYFDEVQQLEQIKDLILQVFNFCLAL